MPSIVTEQNTGLRTAVDELLRAEGRRNEYGVGIVRVAAYSMVAVLDIVLFAVGTRPLGYLLSVLPFVALSVVFLVWLRRDFHPALRYLTPLLDAVFITTLLNIRINAGGLNFGIVAATSVACGLFAATGGIRVEKKAALWTTVLSIVTFVLTVGWRENASAMSYSLVAIAAIGLLSMWQSDLARRALAGERGRATLKRFLHDELVEKAFTDPHGLISVHPRETEATVLVSDLRGFTELAERRAPTEVLEILNDVQGALAQAVREHGGVVDKFMGDGMLATFGAVREVQLHADAAVRCAEAILARVEQLNDANPDRARVQVGIGIHTGRLVVGTVGSGDRLEFTVIGDAVNTASRLESMTKELGTPAVISEATMKAGVQSSLVERGEVPLRGRKALVRVYTFAQGAAGSAVK